MKFRIPKRQAGMSGEAFLTTCCKTLDSSIPALRTACLIAGVIAAGLRLGSVGDFLFVTGLLLHFSIWFENWWVQRRHR
ncbi:hypothetical protein [Massilia sp. BSC265]|uniref:hypothetical protein n=1 Tax=Massilia sp. BSC265 TaxID=1549812 RepID=UPI0004E8C7C3|nr:hypothetical protein [Massilia sp. BSC265]KFI08759.1 hypothetical protein JN27_00960 [Massilia sp. BSC265]